MLIQRAIGMLIRTLLAATFFLVSLLPAGAQAVTFSPSPTSIGSADSGGPLFLNPMLFGSGATGANYLVVADLNGDGKPDLAVASACPPRSDFCGGDYDGYVGVLLGNGDGTFEPAVVYDAEGVSTDGIAVADVNGDGVPDIVVSNDASNTMGVFIGNGDGTFQPVALYDSGGGGPETVVIADLNGDGKPDILVANYSTCYPGCGHPSPGWVSVLLGNGDGTFQRAQSYLSGGFGGSALAVADLNGDGILDVAVTHECGRESACSYRPGTVSVMLGNGDGSFGRPVSYSTREKDAGFVAIGDINGDGKLDMVVTDYDCQISGCRDYGSISVFLGNGDGTFQPATTFYSGGDDPNEVLIVDVNNDGKPDLIVANGCEASTSGCPGGGYPGVVSLLIGNGDGTFQTPINFPSGGYWYSYAVAFADVNGDGKPDIIVTNQEGTGKLPPEGSIGVLLNNTH